MIEIIRFYSMARDRHINTLCHDLGPFEIRFILLNLSMELCVISSYTVLGFVFHHKSKHCILPLVLNLIHINTQHHNAKYIHIEMF